VVIYFCPAIEQEVENGYPTSQAFGGWTWREIGPRAAGLYWNETYHTSFPYHIQGAVVIVSGLVLFVGALLYAPVKTRVKAKPGRVKEVEEKSA
jgi:hypothetical protein